MQIYCYSDNEERFHFTNTADEMADVADEAFATYPDAHTVYMGERRELQPETWIDGDDIVDRLAERAYEEVGECCEGWPDVTREEVQLLTEKVQNALTEWLDITKSRPKFYAVDGVKEFHRNA